MEYKSNIPTLEEIAKVTKWIVDIRGNLKKPIVADDILAQELLRIFNQTSESECWRKFQKTDAMLIRVINAIGRISIECYCEPNEALRSIGKRLDKIASLNFDDITRFVADN